MVHDVVEGGLDAVLLLNEGRHPAPAPAHTVINSHTASLLTQALP